MPDLQPDVRDELERRLRDGLHDMVEDAPEFRGLRTSEPRRRRRRVGVLVVAGCAVAALAVVITVRLADNSEVNGGPPSASCAAQLRFHGVEYDSGAALARTPSRGERLGSGTQAGCDDGGASEPDRKLSVYAVAGVDPGQAVFTGDVLWLRSGAEQLPALLQLARTPVPCSLPGPVIVTGTWVGATPTKKVRFDGDLRAPYTIDLRVRDRAIVPSPYVAAVVAVSVTTGTDEPKPADVKEMLQHGASSRVTLRCSGTGYVADSITRE